VHQTPYEHSPATVVPSVTHGSQLSDITWLLLIQRGLKADKIVETGAREQTKLSGSAFIEAVTPAERFACLPARHR